MSDKDLLSYGIIGLLVLVLGWLVYTNHATTARYDPYGVTQLDCFLFPPESLTRPCK